MYQPKTISKAQMNSRSNYYVYGANGIIGKTNNFNHFTKQICIGCRGTVGNVFITNEKAWINGNAMVVNVDAQTEIINKMYLYYYLKNCNFKNIVSGSSQPQIVRGSLENYMIKLPNIKEQNQIEYLLSSFEKIAVIENKKLNNYIVIKKFLLNNLFI